MALSTQTGSAVSALKWKYDVFLSFRGTDTRKGITNNLYNKLQRRGIRTFRDDPQLERGSCISPELLAAIEQSRFAIVILSPNYATSKWCLMELSKICACMEERGAILPVFFGVEPSHVRGPEHSFAVAFQEHEKNSQNQDIEGWKDALKKVGSLAGWCLENYRYEKDLIRVIVQDLSSRLHPSFTVFGSSEKLVGMETKLEEIDALLDTEANDVRFIGIWGMGGLGKTTLARLVYEKFSHRFQVRIFLANVREVATTHHGIHYLQKQILSQISKEESFQDWDANRVISNIKRCFSNNAVLLVLDDVDQSEHIENLVGEKDEFGSRSRIIITTRDRHVLVAHDVEEPYELKGLNENDALELFSWKAFRKNEPEENYADYSKSFVMYAGGVPLALKMLGSSLYKRTRESWRSALKKLQQTPHPKVTEMLKISFDGLDMEYKNIFLDIACFHKLYSSSKSCPCHAIEVLVERSLITISSDDQIVMHDLIKEMGCEIVRKESYEEPGRRSRLWLRNDIVHVLTNNTGTEVIKGIFLHLDKLEEADWNLEAFSKMYNMEMLLIHNLRLRLGPKYLPNALRILRWCWYPSKSLPPGFQPNELTDLSLVHSNIHQLWDGKMCLNNLTSINLRYSINLKRTPDFTGTPNLEELDLEGCTDLVNIDPSIKFLKRLRIWNFRNCKSIESLPSKINMKFLETFDVSGCSKLKMIPEFGGEMKRISKLSFDGTAVKKLPSSIVHSLKNVKELDLSGSVKGKRTYPLIPLFAAMKEFSFLTKLMLNDCNLCQGEIPNDIGSVSSLECLELKGNNFVSLPESIRLLSKLETLDVEDCKNLEKLPDLPVSDFLWVSTNYCTSLQVFPDPLDLSRLSKFSLSCINCLTMVRNQDSSHFLYSVLKRIIEEPPCPLRFFYHIIPGSEIVDWFSNQSVGNSITEKLPPYAGNSKLIGIAVCALLVPQDNPSAVPEQRNLPLDTCHIMCYYKGNHGLSLNHFGYLAKQIVSDHLFIIFVPIHRLEGDEANFLFETTRAVGNNKRCLKVKKCGVGALYEHDMEELISKMNQSKRGIISVYEHTDEQVGAMVNTTQDATTSGSRGFDC